MRAASWEPGGDDDGGDGGNGDDGGGGDGDMTMPDDDGMLRRPNDSTDPDRNAGPDVSDDNVDEAHVVLSEKVCDATTWVTDDVVMQLGDLVEDYEDDFWLRPGNDPPFKVQPYKMHLRPP